MFTIDNHLCEYSFQYNADELKYLGTREDELLDLQGICDHCRINNESLLCDLDKFYDAEVEPGVSRNEISRTF